MTDEPTGFDGDQDPTEADSRDAGTDSEEDVPAVAAMGGTDKIDALARHEDYEERIEPDAGGLGRPTPALPIDRLEAIEPLDCRALAQDPAGSGPAPRKPVNGCSRRLPAAAGRGERDHSAWRIG